MANYKNITESGVITTKPGFLDSFIVNAHSSGTLKVYDGTEGGANAVGIFTSTGAMTSATHGTTKITSSGAMVPATHAVSVLTGNAIVAGNIVVIGTKTYTFSNNCDTAYEVLVGSTLTASLLNLKNAINGNVSAGGFNASTPANADVIATASNATTVTVRARVIGTSKNNLATTGTALRTVWADTTLGGGTGASDAGVTTDDALIVIGDQTYTVVAELTEAYGLPAVPYQVKKGLAEANMLDNLKSAINGTTGAGTVYSTGTVKHPYVIATTNTDTTQVILARTVGGDDYTTAINGLDTTTTCANTAWEDTTFGGGTGNSNPSVTTSASTITIGNRTYTYVTELSETSGADPVADQVYYTSSVAVALDNLKKAINASGIAGTDYSTGTTEHSQVTATTNANDAQTVQAKISGVAGNSIATTDTMDNHAWGAGTLASGTGATGKVLLGTITFPAVTVGPLTYTFPEPVSFSNGLYATIGGTSADITFTYN